MQTGIFLIDVGNLEFQHHTAGAGFGLVVGNGAGKTRFLVKGHYGAGSLKLDVILLELLRLQMQNSFIKFLHFGKLRGDEADMGYFHQKNPLFLAGRVGGGCKGGKKHYT